MPATRVSPSSSSRRSGLTSFAAVVALDAVRLVTGSEVLSRIEIYLVALPGIAWFAVMVELARPADTFRSRVGEVAAIFAVAVLALAGAGLAGSVDGPLRTGHWVMFAVISLSSLGAMVKAVLGGAKPGSVVGFIIVATLFFALGNAILVIPLGLVPSWLALASTGFDVALLGVAVAIWDAFDEGQALRADMRRSIIGTLVISGPVRGPGSDRHDRARCRDRSHGHDDLVVHQPGGRRRRGSAGRSAGRDLRPVGVLPVPGPSRRP